MILVLKPVGRALEVVALWPDSGGEPAPKRPSRGILGRLVDREEAVRFLRYWRTVHRQKLDRKMYP